jgi:hypothetical protein
MMGRLWCVLVIGLLMGLPGSAQDSAPRWWRRPPADSGVVGLGTAVSLSREMAIDRARENALADMTRQRSLTLQSDRVTAVRESIVADSGSLARESQLREAARARTEVGTLRERVQVEQLSGQRFRAWVLLR